MAIYFDMDGVLADFKKGVDQTGAEYAPLGTINKAADDAMWDAIRATPHFYLSLPEIPSGVRLFKSLQAAGENPEILTAIPKPVHEIHDAEPDKIAWVGRHLGKNVKTHICFRAEKQNYCKKSDDILIDDQAKNITEWESAGGTGILFQADTPVKIPAILALKLKPAMQDGLSAFETQEPIFE